jgi:hypothetical protein
MMLKGFGTLTPAVKGKEASIHNFPFVDGHCRPTLYDCMKLKQSAHESQSHGLGLYDTKHSV